MKYLPLVTEMQHPVFSRNLFYPGTALLCSILSFPGIYSIQELLCSAAFCLFQESILSRNCSDLQHPVFARNLFYPGTALLCSILSFPGIYSIQELLCSAVFCLFQESILSRNCFALQHSVFFRNLFYPRTALLCSILSFPGIYSIQELLCSVAFCLFQEFILFWNRSALQDPVYFRIILHLGTSLLCSIICFPEIYSNHELLLSSAEPCRNKINARISKLRKIQ